MGTYVAYIQASNTVTDEVANQVMHRICNTNWQYSYASFTLKFD